MYGVDLRFNIMYLWSRPQFSHLHYIVSNTDTAPNNPGESELWFFSLLRNASDEIKSPDL